MCLIFFTKNQLSKFPTFLKKTTIFQNCSKQKKFKIGHGPSISPGPGNLPLLSTALGINAIKTLGVLSYRAIREKNLLSRLLLFIKNIDSFIWSKRSEKIPFRVVYGEVISGRYLMKLFLVKEPRLKICNLNASVILTASRTANSRN